MFFIWLVLTGFKIVACLLSPLSLIWKSDAQLQRRRMLGIKASSVGSIFNSGSDLRQLRKKVLWVGPKASVDATQWKRRLNQFLDP